LTHGAVLDAGSHLPPAAFLLKSDDLCASL
jgi:hypothetical protein